MEISIIYPRQIQPHHSNQRKINGEAEDKDKENR